MQPTAPPPAPGSYVPGEVPKVIVWYKVYLGVLSFLFFLVAAAGVFFLLAPLSAEDLDGMPPEIMGGIYLVMGLIFLIPVVIAFFLPKTPGAWIYHLVMICIGMTGCTLVASILLLIFWIKPDVKGYFGKNPY